MRSLIGWRRRRLGTISGLFRDTGCAVVGEMSCVIWEWEVEIYFKSCKESYRKIGVQALGQKRLKCFCGFGKLKMHFVLIEFAPKFVSQWYLKHETHLWSVWISWGGMKCILPAQILHVLAAGLWQQRGGISEPLLTSAASQECVR